MGNVAPVSYRDKTVFLMRNAFFFFFFACRLGRLWFQEDPTPTPKKFLLPADYVELPHSQSK